MQVYRAEKYAIYCGKHHWIQNTYRMNIRPVEAGKGKIKYSTALFNGPLVSSSVLFSAGNGERMAEKCVSSDVGAVDAAMGPELRDANLSYE